MLGLAEYSVLHHASQPCPSHTVRVGHSLVLPVVLVPECLAMKGSAAAVGQRLGVIGCAKSSPVMAVSLVTVLLRLELVRHGSLTYENKLCFYQWRIG